MRPVYLFDDGRGQLAPLTDLRASFEVRVGPLTLLEQFQQPGQAPPGFMLWGLFARAEIAALCRERSGLPVNGLRSGGVDEPVLAVNGRWAVPHWGRLAALQPGQVLIEAASGDLAAAFTPESELLRVLAGDRSGLKHEGLEGRALMSRPWHARAFRDAALKHGLALLTGLDPVRPGLAPPGVSIVGDSPVRFGAGVRAYPGVVLDAEGGPIAIAAGATVRPGAVLVGPCSIGPHTTVLDRAVIRANTVVGPHCKVAGEISGTIFQGYSNKAHDGFLGDCWVGEWANLGAGTTNSNLLNTYGEVVARAMPGGPNERTGEQFLGAVIGDHVKTAICTRLMTGTVIHTGAMLAQTAAAAGCIPPFAWMTDEGSRRYRLDKFVEVARAAMSRRAVTPSEAYLNRLGKLHEGGAERVS